MPARAIISGLSAVIDADTSCTLSDRFSAVTRTSSIRLEVPSANALDPAKVAIATAKANTSRCVVFIMLLSQIVLSIF